MDPERWRQIRDLLDGALQLEGAERSAFLDRSCSSDHSLRQEVEKLLAAEGELPTSFLESPAVALGTPFVSYTGETVLFARPSAEEHLRAAIHEALPLPRGIQRHGTVCGSAPPRPRWVRSRLPGL